LRLAELDFAAEYRAASKIKHIDALCRHVQTVTIDQTLSKELVRDEQKTDKFCNTLEVGKPKGKSE
jgi:bacterioferritin (cytochrome b1)